ncbi:MAG: hypothetical protein WDO06_06545 [Actinomycetota bacterium]
MSFVFENLDPRTRELMLKEIDFDIAHGGLYLSKRFYGTWRRRSGSLCFVRLVYQAMKKRSKNLSVFLVGHT